MENNLASSVKLKMCIPCDPAILLVYNLEKFVHINQDISSRTFIKASFI